MTYLTLALMLQQIPQLCGAFSKKVLMKDMQMYNQMIIQKISIGFKFQSAFKKIP